MAIVKMDKFNLFSFENNRSNLLDILQKFNYVHFNDLAVDEKEDYLKKVSNQENLTRIDEERSRNIWIRKNYLQYKERTWA